MRKSSPEYKRAWNVLERVLCIFVTLVVLLSAVVVTLNFMQINSRREDEFDRFPSDRPRHRTHQISHGAHLNGELETLEDLKERADEANVEQSNWLPSHMRRKRTTLDLANPFIKSHSLDLLQSVHVLDLRAHKRVSDDTFFLGEHPHPREANVMLQTYAFVHYIRKAADSAIDSLSTIERSEKKRHFNRANELSEDQRVIDCGSPISAGTRWRTSRGYYLHPQNGVGMAVEDVIAQTEAAADTWRCAFRSLHMEPLGPLLGVTIDEDTDEKRNEFEKPTGENHILFAKLKLPDGDEDSTLAVTLTHGIYDGPVNKRFISEFTTIINDAYKFADCERPGSSCKQYGQIDLRSILVHELGHGVVGLDDSYASHCASTTMFWNAMPGETNKRTLSDDDIKSMIALYSK